MARKVYGSAVPQNGAKKGLIVEAWDEDPGGDDFMGRDTTDSKGAYSISYAGGHWDPGVHAVTTWRPDIYVKVLTKTKNGRSVEVARSKTYENQKLRSDRKINLTLPSTAIESKVTAFKPEKHGLPFANSFSFKVHWTLDGLGFCGGMSAYAVHKFNAGEKIPATLSTPKQGSRLYTELLCRQIASLYAIPLDDLRSASGVLGKLARPHTLFKTIVDDIWSWQKGAGRRALVSRTQCRISHEKAVACVEEASRQGQADRHCIDHSRGIESETHGKKSPGGRYRIPIE